MIMYEWKESSMRNKTDRAPWLLRHHFRGKCGWALLVSVSKVRVNERRPYHHHHPRRRRRRLHRRLSHYLFFVFQALPVSLGLYPPLRWCLPLFFWWLVLVLVCFPFLTSCASFQCHPPLLVAGSRRQRVSQDEARCGSACHARRWTHFTTVCVCIDMW